VFGAGAPRPRALRRRTVAVRSFSTRSSNR
jgi:hypothetical protein